MAFRSSHAALACLALALALAARTNAQGKVWVVAPTPGPGIDFVQISDAAHSAGDGDVLLVRSGTYAPFTLAGKSAAVVADAGAAVLVSANGAFQSYPVRVDGTGRGATHLAILQGLSIDSWYPSYSYLAPLQLLGSQGSIWIDRCDVRAGSKPAFSGSATGEPALTVDACASAVFLRSTLRGGDGGNGDDWGDAGYGGVGAHGTGSSLALFDSALFGGKGGHEPVYEVYEPQGGDGFVASAAAVFASNTRFTGGGGGTSKCGAGPGGDGVQLGASSVGEFQTCGAQGGPGGIPTGACGSPGTDGQRFHDAGGSHVILTGPPRTLAFESPLREGQTSTLTVTGVPGELAFLLAAPQPGRFEHPAVVGPILVALPAAITIPLGAIDAGGSASLSFTVNELGPGAEAALVFLQPVLVSAAGAIAVGQPAPLVLLDAAF